jgi:ABC-type multidrug transport system permease subunit
MARRGGFKTQAPKKVTFVISLILWLLGLLIGLGVMATPAGLPHNFGFWALVVSGLLLLLGSMFDGL